MPSSHVMSTPLNRRLRLPAYTTAESATLVQTKPQTVSRWFHSYSPVFANQKERRAGLSYLQLVEVAFAASFRELGVSLQRVRKAHQYLANVFQVEYPFAQLQVRTDGAHILSELEQVGRGHQQRMIVADAAGQQVWPELIADRIAQFDYEFDLALRWHPRGRRVPIVVDPRISFGAPTVESAGIATWVLRERFQAGETLDELEDDFHVTEEHLRAALAFEGVELAA